jgi:ureidoglycolate lyase
MPEPSSPRRVLAVEQLCAGAFRIFGDVIEASEAARHYSINDGYAERYHDLAHIDVAVGGGRAIVNIFRAKPRSLPFKLVLLERHPLGSQAFMPLSALPYLVVVAEGGNTPDLQSIRCFRALPGQGVNYAPGTWHHPLIALQAACDFLVIDRAGASDDKNCDVHTLQDESIWVE